MAIEINPQTSFMEPGDRVEINGVKFDASFTYIGRFLKGGNGIQDPCLIDPSANQQVASGNPDIAGKQLEFYPTYDGLKPTSKLAYLMWLRSGRRDPSFAIGYVFLYFYGLERALIVDKIAKHRVAIRQEVQALLKTYGFSSSIRNYAKLLLDCDDLQSGAALAPVDMRTRNGIELALGKRAAGRLTLTPADLFKYATISSTGGKAIIEHCWEEFLAAYQGDVDRVFENVDLADTTKWRGATTPIVQFSSSAMLNCRLSGFDAPRLPLPHDKWAPFAKLLEIAKNGIRGFKKYLAAVRVDPDQRGLSSTLNLISVGATHLDAKAVDKKIRPWSEDAYPATLAELQADLKGLIDGKIDVKSMAEAEHRLAPHGLYFSPSALLGDIKKVDGDTKVQVIAAAAIPYPKRPLAWGLIHRLIGLSVLIASGTNRDENSVAALITDEITTIFNDLPPHASASIPGLVRYYFREAQKPATLLRELRKTEAEFRRSTALFAVAAAFKLGADTAGQGGQLLAKIYAALGQDDTHLWEDMHNFDAGAGAARSQGAGLVDFSRVASIMAETSDTHKLLSDIFEEPRHPTSPVTATPVVPDIVELDDDVSEPGDQPASTNPDTSFPAAWRGLPEKYAKLLIAIGNMPAIARDDFDCRAAELGLMPEGAIETINEWAFDLIDGPVFEENGTDIQIDQSIFRI